MKSKPLNELTDAELEKQLVRVMGGLDWKQKEQERSAIFNEMSRRRIGQQWPNKQEGK